jgi:hypothetical protein
MAEPMTADEYLAALKAEGVKVQEWDGWRTHNRNHKGAWGPLNGVMIHHTAGVGNGMAEYCHDGDSDLPGPLCQGFIAKDGTFHLLGWGRANHAGGGDPRVLDDVIAERYPVTKTAQHEGSSGAVDGNAHFVGYECENKGDGKDPWPEVQLDTMVRATVAVLRHYGWTVNSAIRHMDWSDWKNDPRGVDWDAFRARVEAMLSGKPTTPKPDPGTPTTPTLPKVSLAKLVAAAQSDPGAAQGSAKYRTGAKVVEQALAKLGYLDAQWVDGSYGTKTVTAYAALQRYLGYTGSDADGIPGSHSLTWLGNKSQLFTTTA